jgi:phosphohistidine swiveling domain-containing protein
MSETTPTTPDPTPKKRRRWVAPTVSAVVALIVGVAIGNSGSSSDKAAASDKPAPTVTVTETAGPEDASPAATVTATHTVTATVTATAPTAAKPTQAAPPANGRSDKGWTLVSLQTKADFTGNFSGTARIANANASTKTAIFTVTLLKGDTVIASLQGSANSVSAGQTVTVDLISEDKFAAGNYQTEFQVDMSY